MLSTNNLGLLTLISLLLISSANARFISQTVQNSDLVSDGGREQLNNVVTIPIFSESTCEMTYGFLPCTTTAAGNVFLILVYGYLMYLGATYLSAGSELLLEILGPGIIGGLFLPMLGALPDAMLILGTP